MSKRLNMSNDEAVEWLLSLKNLDICGENRKTAINKAITALKAHPTRVDETYLSIKDAISELKAMREHIVGYMSIVGTTAYDMGIEALEAQPCIEDYPTCTECEHYDREKHYCPRFCQVIKDTLAEAQPSEDCISREAVNVLIDELARAISDEKCCISRGRSTATIMRDILHLPSVIPQRLKGKWKRIAGFEDCNYDKCSVCGAYQLFYYGKPSTNYCPNCGAEMNGGGEDEDSN